MSQVSWDTFERYRQKGLDARRAGQWDSARIYLLEAARAMIELSKQAQGEELREGRREMANKLLELARDSDEAKRENRKSSGANRKPSSAAESSDSDDGKNASTEGEQKSLRRVGKKRTVPERSYEQWAQQEREQQGRGAADNQRDANRVQSGVPV